MGKTFWTEICFSGNVILPVLALWEVAGVGGRAGGRRLAAPVWVFGI
jgi:hypothetical protein